MTQMTGTTAIGVQGGQPVGQAGAAKTDPTLKKAAEAFEAIFLRQMIGAMRSSSLAEGMFDSSASEQFRDMADARTADQMSRTGSFGIAEMLLKQLAPVTAANPAPAAAPVPAGKDEQP